ncbi:ATP synthase subunit H [Carpediemonas membranifera]|uniref:ATP synthase subunit H n=1 Tax=Carpediemonas membranifera TaxID=201153 RepID=A0A8J6C176_9EUKA|nr:ATP synthase subunit H [Carpediemonas membranifera]|eukprot:KAG9397296.1 ATP synthase subunit H [Carpediemonas membranifera]
MGMPIESEIRNIIVMAVGSLIFALIGSVGCFCWGKNGVVYRTIIIGGAFCIWLLWICTFMAQMNPQLLPARPEYWLDQH